MGRLGDRHRHGQVACRAAAWLSCKRGPVVGRHQLVVGRYQLVIRLGRCMAEDAGAATVDNKLAGASSRPATLSLLA